MDINRKFHNEDRKEDRSIQREREREKRKRERDIDKYRYKCR